MLYTYFPEFLNMSLTASAVILILVLLRPLLRKAPHAISMLLWGVVLFRLVCPVSFSSSLALLRGAQTVNNRIEYLPAGLIEDTVRLGESRPVAVAAETITEAASGSLGRTDLVQLLLIIGTWGWIIGIAVFLLINTISLFRLHRQCIGAVQTEKNIYLADCIETPFVFGIFKPRIYLPSTLTETQQELILQHERTHITRLDPLWKLIGFLTLILHWFNPVVWLGFHLFVRDMETTCDERVLSTLSADKRADYAETLLYISAGKRTLTASPAFGEDSPKTRIKRILKYKKPITIVSVLVAVFAIILAATLLANPKTETGLAGEVIPEFPGSDYKYYGISVCFDPERDEQYGDSSYGYYGVGEEDTLGIVYFLENMSVETIPASESRAESRDKSNTLSLGKKDRVTDTNVHFNSDFSEVWIDNHVKPSYTYAVQDPDSVRELFTFLLTGQTESALLNAVFESHRVASTDEYITAIYCPAMKDNAGSIKIGTIHARYLTHYLYTSDWSRMLTVKEKLPSPESVEFVLRDDYRIQIWKNPRRAVIRDGEEETWFTVPVNTYSGAVHLVTSFSLPPEEADVQAQAETTETPSPTTAPTTEPTMSPTPEPTATPAPTSESESFVDAPAQPEPTPDSSQADSSYVDSEVEIVDATPEPTPTPVPETE